MARVIFKYPLKLTDTQLVEIPEGAERLTVQLQRDTICLWAIVDIRKQNEVRTVHIVGTGHPVPDGFLEFLGTVQMAGGSLVWHVFMEVK